MNILNLIVVGFVVRKTIYTCNDVVSSSWRQEVTKDTLTWSDLWPFKPYVGDLVRYLESWGSPLEFCLQVHELWGKVSWWSRCRNGDSGVPPLFIYCVWGGWLGLPSRIVPTSSTPPPQYVAEKKSKLNLIESTDQLQAIVVVSHIP